MDEAPSAPESAEITPDIGTPIATPPKTPRYKQCYRLEWESMPDFKGWLRGVPNEPTRAYCTYCDKTLHAHRLSLLKHTCTLKHTKAAQSAFSMKQMALQDVKGNTAVPQKGPSPPVKNEKRKEEDEEEEDGEEDSPDNETNASDDGAASPNADVKPPANKLPRMDLPPPSSYSASSSPLSTHVLDTAKGNPVSGLQVTLYKLIEGRWTLIHEGFTNPDGRYTEFIDKANFVAGRYKLHFDVDRYFELRRQDTLYPFIEIVFDVKSPQDHYHVPLLLSPFGYTTYRGS